LKPSVEVPASPGNHKRGPKAQVNPLAHVVDDRWLTALPPKKNQISPLPLLSPGKINRGDLPGVYAGRGHGQAPGTPHSPKKTYQNFEEIASASIRAWSANSGLMELVQN
ncbi:hypothetical protein L0F63_004130, partial [Massospora cicadina]